MPMKTRSAGVESRAIRSGRPVRTSTTATRATRIDRSPARPIRAATGRARTRRAGAAIIPAPTVARADAEAARPHHRRAVEDQEGERRQRDDGQLEPKLGLAPERDVAGQRQQQEGREEEEAAVDPEGDAPERLDLRVGQADEALL